MYIVGKYIVYCRIYIVYCRCRNPKFQPLGYVSDEVRYSERSPEQVEILRERSKRYLALHLIFGAFVLGVSLVRDLKGL